MSISRRGLLSGEVEGNKMLRNCLQLLCACEVVGTFGSIENPSTSRIRKIPEIQKLSQRLGTEIAVVDQCSFGSNDPFSMTLKKHKTFLGTLPD